MTTNGATAAASLISSRYWCKMHKHAKVPEKKPEEHIHFDWVLLAGIFFVALVMLLVIIDLFF